MDTQDINLRKLVYLSLGISIQALGGALAAVHMFRGNTTVVTAGFVLFVVGYYVVQAGFFSRYGDLPGVRSIVSTFWVRDAIASALLISSILLVANGFVVGARASESPTIETMFVSGTSIVGGYILGHIGIQREIL